MATANNPHSEDVKPDRPITYRLSSVESRCGPGTVSGQATVKGSPLLATEPGADWVSAYPNPGREFVPVSLANPATDPARLTFTDGAGRTVWQQANRDQKTAVPLTNQAVRLYYLHMQRGGQTATSRVLKTH